MARDLEGSHISANGMNHTCLFLPNRSWSSFTDPGMMEGRVGLSGWLHTEIPAPGIEPNTSPIRVLTGPDVG